MKRVIASSEKIAGSRFVVTAAKSLDDIAKFLDKKKIKQYESGTSMVFNIGGQRYTVKTDDSDNLSWTIQQPDGKYEQGEGSSKNLINWVKKNANWKGVAATSEVFADDDDYLYYRDVETEDENGWSLLRRKSIPDSDGFMTEYSLYTNGETYICMFGDSDVYTPSVYYADYESTSRKEAMQWFDNYKGFADDEDEDY